MAPAAPSESARFTRCFSVGAPLASRRPCPLAPSGVRAADPASAAGGRLLAVLIGPSLRLVPDHHPDRQPQERLLGLGSEAAVRDRGDEEARQRSRRALEE